MIEAILTSIGLCSLEELFMKRCVQWLSSVQCSQSDAVKKTDGDLSTSIKTLTGKDVYSYSESDAGNSSTIGML